MKNLFVFTIIIVVVILGSCSNKVYCPAYGDKPMKNIEPVVTPTIDLTYNECTDINHLN